MLTIDSATGTYNGKTGTCELIDVRSNGMGQTYVVSMTVNGKSAEYPVTLEKGHEMMQQFRAKCGLPQCSADVAEMYDEAFGKGTAAKIFPSN